MIKNSGYNLRFSLLFGGHLCIIKQRFLERSIERNRNMSASVRSMTGYGRGEHIADELQLGLRVLVVVAVRAS